MTMGFGSSCTHDSPTTAESAPITLSTTEETLVAAEAGSYSACDVWFAVPDPWETRVTLRLYGRVGASRVLLRQVALARVGATTGEADLRSGIAISIRGRPCAGFELTVQATAGPTLDDGRFYLQAWAAAVEPSSAGGDPVPEVATPVPMVAATLLAVDSGGNLRQVRADSSGRLLAGTADDAPKDVPILAATAGVSENVFTRVATIELALPTGVTAMLVATLETSNPENAAELRLFNVTDGIVATDGTIATTSTLPERLTMAVSTLSSLKTYELQLRLMEAGPTARALCTQALLRLEPS